MDKREGTVEEYIGYTRDLRRRDFGLVRVQNLRRTCIRALWGLPVHLNGDTARPVTQKRHIEETAKPGKREKERGFEEVERRRRWRRRRRRKGR